VERCRAADLIVHAGDLSAVSALEELRALGPPVHAVHGNVDEPALRELLPEQLVVEVEDARIGVVHIRDARLLDRFPDCQAIVFGHTHLPLVERHEGVWLLNPGSPTERRRGPFHSMLELSVSGRRIRPELIRLSTG
jgi:putative phosphoesterase